MSSHIHTAISSSPLDSAHIIAAAHDPRCGAVASFIGAVRNHDNGLDVTGIDYSAHPNADAILRDIAEHFISRPGVHSIEVWHRTGSLQVGDLAMVVAVGAEHRAQAFGATEAIVEEIKARLPIWKKQILADGSHMWSGLP
ncbi:MAG: molybdenum cofactor biosynthesis protein MoaE [Actinomycetaceae bacterium]|nr:molybdenum cofactor biosynthesis protein MoaE [Actinomycetaceae bacterium]